MLGADVLGTFGVRLPYLLKVLAIDAPLSLQAHPDPRQAREGFADEEARRVPVGAPERRYRDPAAKLELLCALTEVEALCGFRDPARSAVLLGSLGVEALDPVTRRLAEGPPAQAVRDVWPGC